jgi:aspartate/methionine/tyrosine aminotransferase
MADADYYGRLRERFAAKRGRAVSALESLGFRIYDSGSSFYLWVRIPERFGDAMQLNESLISTAGVAAVPGSAFADTDRWDAFMRVCIAREDDILTSALGKLRRALGGGGAA